MVKLNINDVEYVLPERITLKEYREILKWDFNNQIYWTRILSDIMNVPYELMMEVPEETKEVGLLFVLGLINPQEYKLNKVVKGEELLDVNKITFGKFIDIEVILSNSGTKDLTPIVKELYGITDDYLYVDEIWGGIQYYLNFRTQLYKSYEALFGLKDDGYLKEDIGEKTPVEYSWYKLIMVLADEKFLNIDKVVDRPLYEALNFLAYMKDKTEQEKQILNDLQGSNRYSKRYM